MGHMSVCVHLVVLVSSLEAVQVSHQMVQRGHGPAYFNTVYHNKQGYHQPHYPSEPLHKPAPVYNAPPVKPYHPPPPVKPYHPAPKPYHAPAPKPYHPAPKPYHAPAPKPYLPAPKPYHPPAPKPYHPPAPVKIYPAAPVPAPPAAAVVPVTAHNAHHLPIDSPLYRAAPHPLHAASHLVPQVVAAPLNYIHDNPHKYQHKTAPLPPPQYPDEPRLYKYAYSVDDDYEGAVLNVKEQSDEYGTQGSYEVSLDDGRHQSVSYVSDKHGGYKAKVAYKDQHSSYTRTK